MRLIPKGKISGYASAHLSHRIDHDIGINIILSIPIPARAMFFTSSKRFRTEKSPELILKYDVPLINHWFLFLFFFNSFVFRLHSTFKQQLDEGFARCVRGQAEAVSHCADNDRGRPIKPTATFLHREWKPKGMAERGDGQLPHCSLTPGRKEATPPRCYASAHHTSHKLHTPFRLVCSGPTRAECYR